MFNFFYGKSKSEILKKIIKSVCVFTAAFSLAALSGCDLVGSWFGGGKNDSPDVVTISQSAAEISVGGTITLTATSSEGRVISWSSSDEEIAEVDNGEVTGISAGTASVTANDGKMMATCEITVKPAENKPGEGDDDKDDEEDPEEVTVTISQTKAEIAVDASITLTATASDGSVIRWSSMNGDIATVSSAGKVTGWKAGVAVIKATNERRTASATCEVTVKAVGTENPPETEVTVSISRTTAEVTVGSTVSLTATASDGSAISWTSSNRAIATVTVSNNVATVNGLKAGTATITAASGTAVAYCTVTVKAAGNEPNYPDTPNVDPESPSVAGKTLVWSDEFNGTSLDSSRWGYQTGTQDHYGNTWGPSDWGNDELQYYTDGANVKVSDGALQIIAKRQNMGTKAFTSARITTRDKFCITYGYIEARIQSPAIEGMWPAFWMLPQPPSPTTSETDYGGWPANGELDIMEAKGRLQNKVDCTLHFGGPTWDIHDMAGLGDVVLNSNIDEWHTYAVDWRPEYIAWIIDGEEIARVPCTRWWTNPSTSAATTASSPFDKPFYILLNLAVGGMYDSYRNPPASFTQASMYVDYVRVYA